MARLLASVLLLTVSGCRFEVDYRGKQITCTGAADCPQGVCSRALGRCLPSGLESEPPVLSLVSALTPTQGRVGTVFTLTLAASEPLERLPTVRAVFDRGGQVEFLTEDPLDALQWTFRWQAPASTPSGLARVQATAVDVAGNEGTLADAPAFLIDTEAPTPSIAGVVFFPPPASPRSSVDALAIGGRALVSFSFDEVIDSGVSLSASVPFLSCEPVATQSSQQVFSCVLDGGQGDGTIVLSVRAGDAVGNEAERPLTLVPPLGFDTTPPSFDLDAGLTHLRLPVALGDRRSPGEYVEGGPGVVEIGALVQGFVGGGATTELGRAEATDAGLLIDVGLADHPLVSVRACDHAGNLSPVVPVNTVELRSAPGPHPLTSAVIMGAAAKRLDRSELVPLLGTTLVRDDDAGVLLTGQPSWVRRSVQWASSASAGTEWCLVYDEGRATVVGQAATSILFYNGRDMIRPIIVAAPRSNAGMAYDRRRGVSVIWGGQGGGTDVAEVREQTLRTVTTTNGPAPRSRHVLVFDGERVQLLGGEAPPGVTWRWDGLRWSQHDAGAMPQGPTGAAYDLRRDEVLAITSVDGGSPRTWKFKAGVWSELPVDGGPSSSIGSMVYDVAGDRFLFNSITPTSADVHAFEGGGWRLLGRGLSTLRHPNGSTYSAVSDEWLALGSAARNDLYVWREDAGFVLKKAATGESAPQAPSDFAATSIGRSIYVHGGSTTSATTFTVYRWNGELWATMAPGSVAKRAHAMAYLPGRNEVIVAGGLKDVPAVTDTSAYVIPLLPDAGWPGSAWVELPDAGPLPRQNSVLVPVSPSRALFFGAPNTAQNTQPWFYDGTFTPSPVPLIGARHRMAASFEPDVGLLVTGGSTFNTAVPSPDGPLWLVADGGVERLDAGLPKPRVNHSSVFEPNRREHLLFGGGGDPSTGESLLGDVVRVRLRDAGVSITVDDPDDPEGDGDPSPRTGHFAMWEPEEDKMVVFGGRSGARTEVDVWDYFTDQHRPALVTSISVADLDVRGVKSFDHEVVAVAGGDGQLGGVPVSGVVAEIFAGGRWRPFGTDTASTDQPRRVRFAFSSSEPTFAWGTLERLSVRLVPVGVNGTSFATLFVDQVEVSLRFTRE